MTKQALLAEAKKLPSVEQEELIEELADSLIDSDESELSPEFVVKLDRIDSEIAAHPEMLVSLDDAERMLDDELHN